MKIVVRFVQRQLGVLIIHELTIMVVHVGRRWVMSAKIMHSVRMIRACRVA